MSNIDVNGNVIMINSLGFCSVHKVGKRSEIIEDNKCPLCDAGMPIKEVRVHPIDDTSYKLVERKVIFDLEDYKTEDSYGWDTTGMMEDFASTLQHHIKTDCLLVNAHGIDWRGSKGYKVIDLTGDKETIFNSLVPDYECSFQIYKEGEQLYAIVSSHDVPTGGTWYLLGVKNVEKELEDIVYHIGDGSHGYNKQYFFNRLSEVFGMPVEDWERRDATEEFSNVDEGVHVLAIGINSTFYLWLDQDDNICDTIDYDTDMFAEDYYHFIINS